MENGMNHAVVGQAMGFERGARPEDNLAGLKRALGDTPADVEHRRRALAAMATQSMEFREHNVEYGQRYASTAIVGDGTPEPPALDDVHLYVPSTRPGSPLPHAEVEDRDGGRHPLMSLVRPGEFLLIAGENGGPWCDAARALAADAKVPLRALRIGHLDGDYRDPRCTWLRQREIGPEGAVLVRPDRFVAWRSPGPSTDPRGDLGAALATILCRPLA
jgi:2,4-dichlorophenol 6-monooxygenase